MPDIFYAVFEAPFTGNTPDLTLNEDDKLEDLIEFDLQEESFPDMKTIKVKVVTTLDRINAMISSDKFTRVE